MAIRYEYYISGDDSSMFINSATRKICQTFTPSIDHILTKCVLKVYRLGSPGNVVVAIKAVDGDGKPTGPDLDSVTINASAWNTSPNYTWEDCVFSGGITLSASTKYAIVWGCAGANGSNQPHWRMDGSAGTYAGGSIGAANDGTTWTMFTDDDAMFEEWGNPIAGGEEAKVSHMSAKMMAGRMI